MPVTTKSHRTVKHFGLALTFCLASSLTSLAIADNHIARQVKATGTLSAIVNKNYIDVGVSRNQIMVAILAANPHAFRGGNINYMLGGVSLRLPTEESIKNISETDARNLLKQHNRYFRRGQTGDLPTPTFITLTSTTQVEQLVKEKQQQSEKLDTLQDERSKLSDLVKQLEQEKAQRDNDLKELEAKIQTLQTSSHSLGSTTADLKLKLANGELTGEGAKLLEDLQERNQSLNAQLQSARSEMAESTRMEISLERRMADVQEENSIMAEALKKQGLSPASVLADKEAEITPAVEQAITSTTTPDTKTSQPADTTPSTTASQSVDKATQTPAVVTQVAEPAAPQTPAAPTTTQLDSGFMSKVNWIWFLPILGFLLLAGLLWKLLSNKKKQQQPSHKPRTPQPSMYTDYNQAIDPAVEVEQEPPLEVSIKLDVARAYIEAGDHESAREMLDEVMNEGNTQQQLEAQSILEPIKDKA